MYEEIASVQEPCAGLGGMFVTMYVYICVCVSVCGGASGRANKDIRPVFKDFDYGKSPEKKYTTQVWAPREMEM